MAGSLGFDDKILGEKTNYYCSSDEEEDANDSGAENSDTESKGAAPEPTFIPEPEITDYKGYCTNTGVKGVINDWRRFKQLENEKRAEAEREKMLLINKLSLTCRSELDDEREKANDQAFAENLDFDELEDEFLKEYRQRRIEEMRRACENVPKFGNLVELTSSDFVEAIDKERPIVTVIVHIYAEGVSACKAMNGCLMCLAMEYPTVKFCKITAAAAKMSVRFASQAVPALLVYKNGEVVGNFIKISAELGEDFYATDVESFLLEYGFLPEKNHYSSVIKGSSAIRHQVEDDSDSDFDVD